MSSKSKPSGSTTSVQTSEPWAEQKPYLEDTFAKAKDLYTDYNPQYYGGDTYAKPAQSQYDALLALDGAARNDTTGAHATDLTDRFMNNQYLGNDAGSTVNQTFMRNNYGVDAPGSNYLTDIAGSNQSLNSPGGSALRDQASGNLGTSNQGAADLSHLARQTGVGLQGSTTLNDLATHNQSLENPGWGILRDQATNNIGTQNQGAGYLNDLAQMSGTPDNRLSWLADANPAAANVGNSMLGYQATTDVANPGGSALDSYSSGSHLAAGNPYMDAVSSSVLSRVVPQIQSQFINSGTLSSPEAARATASGAASALAPFAYGQFQNEEQNQLSAANSLNSQAMQSRGLQNTAAGNLANSITAGQGLQYGAASQYGQQALEARNQQQQAATQLSNAALQGGQISQQAANSMGNQYLQGAGLQNQAASTLGTQELTGRSQQQDAAKNLSDAALQGGQLQQGAATTLGSQYLQGAGLQNQAASTLGQQSLTGQGLQQGAAQNYTSGYNQQLDNMVRALGLAPQTQQMQYTPGQMLYSSGQTAQNLNQANIDDAVSRWNYDQNLPYDKLNQYANTISGQYGGTSTRTDPYFTNRTGNALSGTLGGGSVGSIFGPVGTVAGGLLGGISSLWK